MALPRVKKHNCAVCRCPMTLLNGDERVMKEAWEECVTSEEQAIAESELSAIIELIRKETTP